MMDKTIDFEFEKETKGAVRYKEVGDEPTIGTLYIRKTALPNGKPPAKLQIRLIA